MKGSIGNLCNAEFAELMQQIYDRFGFERVAEAEKNYWDNSLGIITRRLDKYKLGVQSPLVCVS